MSRQPAFEAVHCLSFHADYACENSGVCCGSGWSIAVERPVEQALRSRLAASVLPLPNGPDGFEVLADPPEGCGVALRNVARVCWFRDGVAGRCALHRNFGEAALPSACRHFPRVCVIEPKRVALSLSHYCPTAAALLFAEAGAFSVVAEPRAFPTDWPFEGLDVRSTFSPFLRPGVLLGFDGLEALENAVVATLGAAPDVHSGLRSVERALLEVAAWTPRGRAVPALIAEVFRAASESTPLAVRLDDPRATLLASVTHGTLAPVLPDWKPSVATALNLDFGTDRALRRYLAARTIGNWVLFHGDDVRILGRYLRLALESVHLFASNRDVAESPRTRWLEAVRSADLWLIHHCDPELLARNLR